MSKMRIQRLGGRTRGQSLVEFALVIPIFLMMLFAVIDMGRLVYINNALAQGAREGARWGSVQDRSLSAAGRTAVESQAANSLAAVPNPVVRVTCIDGVTAAEDATICGKGDVLVVKISSQVTMFTPILAQIVGSRDYTATSKVTVN